MEQMDNQSRYQIEGAANATQPSPAPTGLTPDQLSHGTGAAPRRRFTVGMIAAGRPSYKQLSLDNKLAYATLHDYDFSIATSLIPHDHNPPRHFAWQKLLHARNIIKGAMSGARLSVESWVLFIDMDAFIMDMSVTLDSIVDMALKRHGTRAPLDFIAAADCTGINTGVFLVKASEWSLRFLQMVWDVNDPTVPNIAGWWEQAAVHHVLKRSPELQAHVHAADQVYLNLYPGIPQWTTGEWAECYKTWKAGNFVLHFVDFTKRTGLPKMEEQIRNATAGALAVQQHQAAAAQTAA